MSTERPNDQKGYPIIPAYTLTRKDMLDVGITQHSVELLTDADLRWLARKIHTAFDATFTKVLREAAPDLIVHRRAEAARKGGL